jgi:hypothetical protein
MQIDERTRREMYERLEVVLGAHAADALMEHLPPVRWAEVATKSDLNLTTAEPRSSMDALEHRLLAQMHCEITRVIMWFVLTMLSGVGLAFAAARFS